MKKRLVSLLPMILLAVLTTGCIYDFNPDLQGQSGFLVVEGDIVLGQTCSFGLRRSSALDAWREMEYVPFQNLRVEASDGTVYPARLDFYTQQSTTLVDLTGADPSLQYRLVFDARPKDDAGMQHYASAWLSVVPAATIDGMSYEINDAGTQLAVRISTHSGEKKGYYRWTAEETWEYRADVYARFFFAPAGTVYYGTVAARDTVLPYENGENFYYCWSSVLRDGLMSASTESLSEDRLVDHQLYMLSCYDDKLSYYYSVEIRQDRITEEAYRYWQMMQRNNTDVGGLFSPEPSEMRGNIKNMDDETELVLGYVSVVSPVKHRLFIDNAVTHFHKDQNWAPLPDPEIPEPSEWRLFSLQGYVPVSAFEPDDPKATLRPGYVQLYNWRPRNCADCRLKGGNKNKPEYWPTPEI